jgi:hypothetical protein
MLRFFCDLSKFNNHGKIPSIRVRFEIAAIATARSTWRESMSESRGMSRAIRRPRGYNTAVKNYISGM